MEKKKIKMVNKLLFVLTVMIVYFIVSSCTDYKNEIIDIIYKDTLVRTQYDFIGQVIENKIKLEFSVTNNESKSIYIPISSFSFQSSIGGGAELFYLPNTYFDRPYLYNTITLYPKNADISSISHINGENHLNTMPFFIKIEPRKTFSMIFSFPDDYVNSNTRRMRLIDTVQYEALLYISLIKEEKFLKILNLISLENRKDDFLQNRNILEISTNKMDFIIYESLKLSKVQINKFQSLVINELGNVKTSFICDVRNFKNSKDKNIRKCQD